MSASSATAAAQSKPTIKSMKVNSKLEENVAEYIPFSAEILAKHPSATLTAALNVLNCFTADMFLILVHIIAEKYDHNVDDVIATIKYDERWEQARSHPLVKSMTYFNQEDIDKEMGTIPISRKVKSDVSAEDLHDAEVAPKKAKAAASEAGEAPAPKKSSKKKAAAAEVEEAAPVAEIVETPVPKKASKKKAAAVAEVEEAAAPAEEAVPHTPVTPKKVSKKKVAAEAEETPAAAEPPPAPKKASKKKAAAAPAEAEAEPAPAPKVDEVVEELITNVSAMNLAAEAPPTKSKKVVNKKPSASKSAAAE
jgi:hypothetical protein